MIGTPAIRRNAGRFVKGQSGNPAGRQKRTSDEEELIRMCRERTAEALDVILDLMRNSKNDRVRLGAAEAILARGWGKPSERVELVAKRDEDARAWSEMTPREVYFALVRCTDLPDGARDVALLPASESPETIIDVIRTESVGDH